MPHILFETDAVFWLASLIICLAAFGYLLSIRDKRSATRWCLAVFGGLAIFFANELAADAVFPFLDPGVRGVFAVGGSWLIWVAYLQLAYRFQENPFPREARILLVITVSLYVVVFGFTVMGLFTDGFFRAVLPLINGIGAWGSTIIFVWTTVVFVRKWRRSIHHAQSGDQVHRKRSYRTFALVNLLWITQIILTVTGIQIGLLFWFINLAFLYGLILTYLNHAPEATSFQVKLIGLSLVSVLALLSFVSNIQRGDSSRDWFYTKLSYEALRFTPDERPETAYLVEASTPSFETELGTDLQMSDDSAHVADLGFSFPFFGERWEQVYISPNGTVTFGEPLYPDEDIQYNPRYINNGVPKIAPLYVDLDPTSGGGVFYKQTPDRVVVTWHEVPQWDRGQVDSPLPNSMQLVLHHNGVIEMSYKEVGGRLDMGSRGLMPGGTALSEASALATASLVEDLPYHIAANTARMEDFELTYRTREHENLLPLIWLILGCTVFVIGVFPFVFRSSLVKPLERVLEGVQRVNAGDLSVDVPVGVRDEIGRLTTHFNTMTGSLQRYHGEMEGLVAERTAQLEQSLDELKTTQAQLVQQEKMASLGQLTAGIAHEIKNPLNFVNNFAEVNEELADEIREDLADHPEALAVIEDLLTDLKQNAAVIAKHGKRADGIVKSMMEHARGGEGQRQTTDVNAFVEEYFNLAYHGMRAKHADFNATLKRDYDESIGQVEMVPQDMGRVLINLLNNAFYAVNEKAQSMNGAYEPIVTVSTKQQEEQVVIQVQDNGPGISENMRQQIFEPFFTTKPTGQGNTGLGLSLSYDIVTQGHGGTMTVESEEGQGATFIITLLA